MNAAICPGCGAEFPERAGPTHRYLESSPGCWAAFGVVLAREYSDPLYAKVHRLSVDAYAVQHPGRPMAQTVRSAALHLVSLCCVLEEGMEPQRATRVMQAAAGNKDRFRWLPPPATRGNVTVADVVGAGDAAAHAAAVRAWAASAWAAWSQHHGVVREWLHDGVRLPATRQRAG